MPLEDRYPGLTTKDALEFLSGQAGKDEPWCCCVSFSEPNEALVVGRKDRAPVVRPVLLQHFNEPLRMIILSLHARGRQVSFALAQKTPQYRIHEAGQLRPAQQACCLDRFGDHRMIRNAGITQLVQTDSK